MSRLAIKYLSGLKDNTGQRVMMCLFDEQHPHRNGNSISNKILSFFS